MMTLEFHPPLQLCNDSNLTIASLDEASEVLAAHVLAQLMAKRQDFGISSNIAQRVRRLRPSPTRSEIGRCASVW